MCPGWGLKGAFDKFAPELPLGLVESLGGKILQHQASQAESSGAEMVGYRAAGD